MSWTAILSTDGQTLPCEHTVFRVFEPSVCMADQPPALACTSSSVVWRSSCLICRLPFNNFEPPEYLDGSLRACKYFERAMTPWVSRGILKLVLLQPETVALTH